MYKDKEAKQPIKFIQFGEVKVGKTQEVTVYIKNDTKRELVRLAYKIKGSKKLVKDIKIVSSPVNILPEAIVPLIFTWTPALDLKMGLKVQLEIKGDIIFRGR